MKLLYKYLIVVWITIPILEFLTPAYSSYDIKYKVYAYMINFSYLLSFFVSMAIGYNIVTPKKSTYSSNIIINNYYIIRIIKMSTYLSILGVISLAIDKIVIQGIDYTNGIAVAKYQLLENAEGRTGTSSIFSIIGYLCLGFCFWSFSLLIVFYEEIKKNQFIIFILFNIVTIFLSSFLTGGRTNLILMVTFFLGSLTLRKYLSKKKTIFTKSSRFAIFTIIILTLSFIVYVFGSRASSNNKDAQLYAETAIIWMEGIPSKYFYTIEKMPSFIANTMYFSIIMIVYIIHSIWTFEGVIYNYTFEGDAIFVGLKTLLSKFNLVDKPIPWEYAGRFIGWPGGVFHDYGIIGIIIISICHGLIFGFNIRMMNSMKITNFIIYILLFSIIITAPFIIYIDLLMIPSVLLASLFLYLYSKVFRNSTIIRMI